MVMRSKSGPSIATAPSKHQRHAQAAKELVDLKCAVTMEVAQTASRAAEHATILESIGARAFEAAGVLSRDASDNQLLRKSHEVRGLVAQALGVLADLQFQAGRMHALAAIRQAAGGDENG